MKTSKKLTRFFVLTALISILFSSCKKDQLSDTNAGQQPNLQGARHNAEQAYPLLQGKIFKLKLNGQDISVEKKGDHYVWMGDIAFDQKTFDSLNANQGTGSRTFKPTNNWESGRVYYTIDPAFTVAERNMVNDAITHWQSNTSLTFHVRTTETHYIYIRRGAVNTGLYSDFIGKKGGQQIINLELGVFNTGSVIHEIGHAIGFYHEQSRTDRGSSITINWGNIQSGRDHNFQTYAALGQAGSQIGTFDFNSIMLYDSWAFSNNGLPTITTLNGGTFFSNRTNLSTGDIETAEFMYGPPFAKVVYENVYYYYDMGMDYEEEYSEDNIYIKLYADAACTIPFTATSDKYINYIYWAADATYYGYYNETPGNVTIPSGSSSVLLHTGLVTRRLRSDLGIYAHNERAGYYSRDGFFR